MKRVLVAGAGVAALECVLGLRRHAGGRVAVELLAPTAELVVRASSVKTPFGAPAAPRVDLGRFAADAGVRLHRDALASVEAAAQHVLTRDGSYVPYDLLVVAVGARSREAVPGAITFRGPMSAGVVEQAVARVAAEPGLRLAFAAPPGVRWLLPLYELALLSAAELRDRAVGEPDILVVTGEQEPLEAFGPAASEAVRRELAGAGIELVTRAAAIAARDGALRLDNGVVLGADVVVALPEVVGPRIPGLPHDDDGFIPVDGHGRVRGAHDIFAAGDATSFPIKHGGLAAEQADAVADAIGARLGLITRAEPFRPVLRGLLLTGERPLYLRADLTPGGDREQRLLPSRGSVSRSALWWPPGKIAGRFLTPFLATPTGSGGSLQDRQPGPEPDELDLIVQAAEEEAAAGDHETAAQILDDAEAWLGPLPPDAAKRRDSWRRPADDRAKEPLMTIPDPAPPGAEEYPIARFTVLNALQMALIECAPDADIRAVARAMAEHEIHCVIVRGIERAGWGIVSDLDLMAAMRPELAGATAEQLAATDPLVVAPTDTLEHAAQLMAEHQTTHAVVVDRGTHEPVGILSTLDVARFAAG
jgi:sulfide:quinone oxidoreductase